MKFFFWRKNEEKSNSAYAPYEEIDAKRTSKLGYFFLILMVLFGIWQGNNLLSQIQNSIDAPESNSSCVAEIARHTNVSYPYTYSSYLYDPYKDYEYAKVDCKFSEREKTLLLDGAYAKLNPLFTQVVALDEELNSIQNHEYELRYQRDEKATDYQASLVEDIAQPSSGGVFDSSQLGIGVVSFDQKLQELALKKSGRTGERDRVTAEIRSIATSYISALKDSNTMYEKEERMHQLMQFLLSFILIAPLFYLVWRRYNSARLSRSEYTIIWGGVVGIFGFMLAQILLVFLYEILPHQIIAALVAFLKAFEPVWILIYWLGFILVPLFFGYLIYFIQKKFYNRQAVMMRALKSGQCPGCSLKFNHTMNNCPVCGYTFKSTCQSCGGKTMSDGSFCEVCGVRREVIKTGSPTNTKE